jgi:hypothetical protein
MSVFTGFSWFRIVLSGERFELDNQSCMKGVEYLVQLSECTSRCASAISKSSEVCKITSIAFGMCVLH